MSNYYTRASTVDDAIITVFKPMASGFVVGAGYLVLSKSAGLVPGDSGSKANFGFSVVYQKGANILPGSFNLILRNKQHVYQIKANSMTSLSILCPQLPRTRTRSSILKRLGLRMSSGFVV